MYIYILYISISDIFSTRTLRLLCATFGMHFSVGSRPRYVLNVIIASAVHNNISEVQPVQLLSAIEMS